MKRLVRLGVPGLISGGVTQLNIVIGTIIASLQAGAVSYLYYADRLYQLPLGIVGIAIGVVLLPDLARNLRAGNHHSVMDNQNRSLEFALLLTLPAAVALAVAAEPIIRVLFERGAFTRVRYAAHGGRARRVRARPAGVRADQGVPAGLLRPRGHPHAHALCGLEHAPQCRGLARPVLPVSRLGFMPHVGIAIATTLSGWANAFLLWSALEERGHFQADDRLRRNVRLISLASLIMGAVDLAAGRLCWPPTCGDGRSACARPALSPLC